MGVNLKNPASARPPTTIAITAATASNYGSYDKAIAPSFNSLYTSGNYSYGLANINLSNPLFIIRINGAIIIDEIGVIQIIINKI